jgi:hypothetical protein
MAKRPVTIALLIFASLLHAQRIQTRSSLTALGNLGLPEAVILSPQISSVTIQTYTGCIVSYRKDYFFVSDTTNSVLQLTGNTNFRQFADKHVELSGTEDITSAPHRLVSVSIPRVNGGSCKDASSIVTIFQEHPCTANKVPYHEGVPWTAEDVVKYGLPPNDGKWSCGSSK